MPSPLRDNTALSRFELDVDGGIAFVNYRRADGVLFLTHTEVPRQLRERGIGGQVVQATLETARAQGMKVTPRCGFVARFIAKHPEFQDLLAEEI
jgi:predicted GNAT family acetyltransferase